MDVAGPVITKKFQKVPEIIKFSLFGFSSKLESELTKKSMRVVLGNKEHLEEWRLKSSFYSDFIW